MYKSYSMELAGRTLTVDIGRVAKQANGAAFMHYGDTTVLSTATDGYHYHLVEAATPDRLDLIGQALQDAGFLAPLQPWEKEK